MASFSDYPGGRIRAVIRRAGYKTRSKIFPSKKKAEAWARDIESGMDSRKYVDPSAFAKDTIGSIFEKFRDEVCPKRKGGRWEKVRINKFIKDADFMRLRVEQLKPSDIREWRDARCDEILPRSVNREMNLLSTVFTYAIKEWEYVFEGGINPMKMVSRPDNSGPKLRHRRWEDHELKLFLEAAEHDENKKPAQGKDYVSWALLLALETAMRPGEFCAAKVKDVKLDRRHLVLHDSKNGEARKVPLSKRAVKILEALVDGKRPEQDVFPISSETLGVYYRELRKKAGLKEADLRFYDIKHEAISRLSDKFSNVLELSAVTGHKSLQSLRYYYNPKVEDLASRLD
jgi:integrase